MTSDSNGEKPTSLESVKRQKAEKALRRTLNKVFGSPTKDPKILKQRTERLKRNFEAMERDDVLSLLIHFDEPANDNKKK